MKFFIQQDSFSGKISIIKKDSVVIRPIIIAFIVSIIGFVVIFLKLKDLPDVVPLFYSLPRAAERLGNKEWLFILPGLSLLILIINCIFVFFLIERDHVLSRILALGSLLTAVLSLYTLLRIIFLIA